MPVPTQFSLELDLSHPIYAAAAATGRSAVAFIRSLRDSGSDLHIEDDLAEVFGRNFIEPRLESAFRSAINTPLTKSTLSKALDLVLELGAGPTVQYASASKNHFRSLVQLSLLAWCHSIDQLSTALAQAFAKAGEHEPAFMNLQGLDPYKLRGTLRACRDQTSSFLWQNLFWAVEAKLDLSWPSRRGISYDLSRCLHHGLLEALLIMLNRVQKLPKDYQVVIQAGQGISVIVVWAHHVLGLNVKVITGGSTHCFGDGNTNVIIEATAGPSERPVNEVSASLFTIKTGKLDFRLTSSSGIDAPLSPAPWHTFRGYGNFALSSQRDGVDLLQLMSDIVIASCVATARLRREEDSKLDGIDHFRTLTPDTVIPTDENILNICALLFDRNIDEADVESVLQNSNLPLSTDGLNEVDFLKAILDVVKTHLRDENAISRLDHLLQYNTNGIIGLQCCVMNLITMVFIFCNVADMTRCADVRINANSEPRLWVVSDRGIPSVSESFKYIVRMIGTGDFADEEDYKQVVAASYCGWTAYLPSLSLHSPASISTKICIAPGSLSLDDVRKDFIRDGMPWHPAQVMLNFQNNVRKLRIFESNPGARIKPACLAIDSKPANNLVAPLTRCYGVLHEFFCSFEDAMPEDCVSLRIGYYHMQLLAWLTTRSPKCSHGAHQYSTAVLPPRSVTFAGWTVNDNIKHSAQEQLPDLSILLVSGHRNSQWISLHAISSIASDLGVMVILKSDDCCFQCAIDFSVNQVPDRPKVLIL